MSPRMRSIMNMLLVGVLTALVVFTTLVVTDTYTGHGERVAPMLAWVALVGFLRMILSSSAEPTLQSIRRTGCPYPPSAHRDLDSVCCGCTF